MVDLEGMVDTVMKRDVDFPMMRSEVIGALRSLADRDLQERFWVRKDFPHAGYFEDLTMNVNILYDDTLVLPDPETRLGAVLASELEVGVLRQLALALDPVIERLGDSPDADYLRDPEWPKVVDSAAAALAVLEGGSGDLGGS